MKNKKGAKGQKFVQAVQKSKEAGEKQRAGAGKTPEQLELEKLRKCVPSEILSFELAWLLSFLPPFFSKDAHNPLTMHTLLLE